MYILLENAVLKENRTQTKTHCRECKTQFQNDARRDVIAVLISVMMFDLLVSARAQETAIRNFAVEHREPDVLAGLTDARVQWPAHRHERVLRDRPPTPAR